VSTRKIAGVDLLSAPARRPRACATVACRGMDTALGIRVSGSATLARGAHRTRRISAAHIRPALQTRAMTFLVSAVLPGISESTSMRQPCRFGITCLTCRKQDLQRKMRRLVTHPVPARTSRNTLRSSSGPWAVKTESSAAPRFSAQARWRIIRIVLGHFAHVRITVLRGLRASSRSAMHFCQPGVTFNGRGQVRPYSLE